ncbi:MAG: ROK family protein [Phaeodactylibacter sp.]|nr:ROK family protein [Phaeodactylibacter sp.]MCB9302355.1 ROK family protein [Lewinellaceae bacterium]HQU57788.1 ROK family protein [Saprospiraceae bacterium]
MQERHILGIDVGASGIKGAVVDIETGELLNERIRLETPTPSTPEAMAETFAELVRAHKWKGLVGCGFPSIVKHGIAYSAANIDKDWMGQNIIEVFSMASGCPVEVLNDADAAGLAEMRFGLGKGVDGVVLLITIGSGLGSALFIDGRLVPNTELGHIYLEGQKQVAEVYTSNNARKRENLSWEEWGQRFNEYLLHLERTFNPDLILLSGGASKRFDKYESFISTQIPVKPAQLLNAAGTIGAAVYAYQKFRKA